jgi:hypothetical protein
VALHHLEELYPNYPDLTEGEDIKSLDLFTEGGEEIGIHDS